MGPIQFGPGQNGVVSMTKLDRGISSRRRAGHGPSVLGNTVATIGRTVLVSLLAVGAVSAVGLVASDVVTLRSISMFYLAAVVASALTGGRGAAILSALLSFLAYNFFFIEPRLTFTVARADEVVALIVFVGVALLTGALAARANEEAVRARHKAAATQTLLDFSAGLSATHGVEAVLSATASLIGQALGLPAAILVRAESGLRVAAGAAEVQPLRLAEIHAAQLAADKRQRTGATTEIGSDSTMIFFPVVSGQRLVAVLGLETQELCEEQNDILTGMMEQAAVAIDRAQWMRESSETNVLRESERLQSALLSSLSHDFRTPLASITGAASSLRQLGGRMDEATRDDLLRSIEEDAGRLNRFVANLFDMTRIESGRLAARREALALPEVVGRAIERIQAIDPSMNVKTSFAADLGDIEGDAVLLEQVLFNLLDNARKYAASSRAVTVFARPEGEWTELSVTDNGKGIPTTDLEHIFEKFYRRGGSDGRGPGTGLGLAIARGFVSAMGGTIHAESPAFRKRGTRFTIRLKPARTLRQ